MIYIALPIGTEAEELDAAYRDSEIGVDSFASDDQATIADWAAQRAAITKQDYQVFKLTEVLYYKGRK